jgi:hypothetical protein
MIPREYLWQDHYGASHRKNVDTPPLTGCCVGTKVPSSEPSEIARGVEVTVPYKEQRLEGRDGYQ